MGPTAEPSCAMHPLAFSRSYGPPTALPHRSSSCASLLDPKFGLSAGPQPTRPHRSRSSCLELQAHRSSGEDEEGSAASNRGGNIISLPTLKQTAVIFAVLAMAFLPVELPFEKSLQLHQHEANAAISASQVHARPVFLELVKKETNPPLILYQNRYLYSAHRLTARAA